MSKNLNIITVLFLSFIIISCSGEKPITQTPSGKPEVTIKTTNMKLVKSKLTSKMLDTGFMLQGQNDNTMTFTRGTTGDEAAWTKLAIGNAYSTNPVKTIQYNIVDLGDEIRVLGSASTSTQMVFGQIHSLESTDGTTFNSIYGVLEDVKCEIQKECERVYQKYTHTPSITINGTNNKKIISVIRPEANKEKLTLGNESKSSIEYGNANTRLNNGFFRIFLKIDEPKNMKTLTRFELHKLDSNKTKIYALSGLSATNEYGQKREIFFDGRKEGIGTFNNANKILERVKVLFSQ